MVKDKDSPGPPKIEDDEESSPLMNSEADSSGSDTLDTTDSLVDKSADVDEDLNNDTYKNNIDDIVADDKKQTEINNNVMMSNHCDDDDIAATKMYKLEPIIVREKAKDCSLISLSDEVFVHDHFTTNENYQFCFTVIADKLNVFLKIGDFYPDRGIFVYGAYTEAGALSSLKLVFINENLDTYSSISWKYFLNLRYPSATQTVIKQVNMLFALCMSNNLTV
jgi:hypothetical protein